MVCNCVRTRFEGQVSTTLRAKGYEEFLPLYRCKRRRSDRVKELELPLFPGYLFCRFNVNDRLMPILTTPGVISIVGAGRTPVPVSDKEIEAVSVITRSGLPVQPWPSLAVGSRVLIEQGPLAGLVGTAINVDKKYRLVVSVELLQRSLSVEIARDWARPVASGAGSFG